VNRFAPVVFFAAVALAAPALASNLLTNGDFEASTDPVTTPPGWTNVGHSDGVINYDIGPVPAYDGSYFYDLGGYGDASGPVGDGIEQAVATVVGSHYTLTFGLSSEDVAGLSELTVNIGSLATVYPLTSAGTYFLKGFSTQTIDYVATSTSTLISFIETLNTSGGNNDPMIDGVIFDGASGSGTPEPASWALMLGGFGLTGYALRRRHRVATTLS
jgi:hypothetical protein